MEKSHRPIHVCGALVAEGLSKVETCRELAWNESTSKHTHTHPQKNEKMLQIDTTYF